MTIKIYTFLMIHFIIIITLIIIFYDIQDILKKQDRDYLEYKHNIFIWPNTKYIKLE